MHHILPLVPEGAHVTPFGKFVEKWRNCQQCYYCETRTRIVLGKGKLPCDVLFIGEAPGRGEDSLGEPFVGPAGHLLDYIIERAGISDLRLYFTNMVCCLPVEIDPNSGQMSKATEPDENCIMACRPRLEEIIQIANPGIIICVGSVAGDGMDQKIRYPVEVPKYVTIERIVHPAFILRGNVVARDLAIRKCALTIANAVEGWERTKRCNKALGAQKLGG